MHVGILIYKILKYIGVALIRHTSPTSEKKKKLNGKQRKCFLHNGNLMNGSFISQFPLLNTKIMTMTRCKK